MKPLVEVFWVDSAFSTEGHGLAKQRSVGYLVKRTKKFIVIAQTREWDGSYGDRLTVATNMLKKVRRIR